MNMTVRIPMLLNRLSFELRRALYSFRRGPAPAVLLLQVPVLVFVYFKGAGPVYLDMAGIMAAIILISWFFTSLVHGNRKIVVYTLMLLTVGTMLQCIFIKEAMLKQPEKYSGGSPAGSLQAQYLLAFAAALVASAVYFNWKGISSMKTCRLLFLISMGLSLFTLLFATAVGGVRNWIRIGGLSIQTTEINKLLYIFLAAGLLGTTDQPSRKRIFAFYFVTGAQALMLMLQGEYGTLLLLLFVFFAFLFLFAPEIKVFLRTLAVFSAAALGLVMAGYGVSRLAARQPGAGPGRMTGLFLKAYGKISSRFIYWMHPEKDPLGLGYQLIKARESIVLGGWFGTASVTQLPVKTSDLVYPALIQRCGMVFALLVFMIFIFMWLEGMKVFVRKADRYHQAVAAGIVIMLFMQAIIIIAGSTGLTPLTGITLPFISSGGSSLFVSFIMAGLLVTISGNVAWKGCGYEETEEFFKESPVAAKYCAGIRHFNHTVFGPYFRAAARRFRRSRPEEGEGKTDHV